MRLAGKRVVIIGGNGLIGQAVTSAVITEGGLVVVASRSPASSQTLGMTAEQAPVWRRLDVSNPEDVEHFFSNEDRDSFDAVVNLSFPRNAHFGVKFETTTYSSFCENLSLHLGGCFNICQHAAERLARRGGGVIINFSSIYGFMAPRFRLYEGTQMTKEVEYSVCKAAILQLTKYMAQYYKGKGLRVNCVSPGGVLNDQDKKFVARYNAYCNGKGMLEAADVAGAVVFLLSDQAACITGQNIVVDDGFSL